VKDFMPSMTMVPKIGQGTEQGFILNAECGQVIADIKFDSF